MLNLQNTNVKKELIELNSQKMNHYFTKINKIPTTRDRLIFICMVSNISSSIEEFFLDLNRKNNVFHNNISFITNKEVKNLYIYESMYILINFLNLNKINESYDKIEKSYFNVFNLSYKEKKDYNFMKENYSLNVDFQLVNLIGKNIFYKEQINKFNFAYTAFYLEQCFWNFNNDYISFSKGRLAV